MAEIGDVLSVYGSPLPTHEQAYSRSRVAASDSGLREDPAAGRRASNFASRQMDVTIPIDVTGVPGRWRAPEAAAPVLHWVRGGAVRRVAHALRRGGLICHADPLQCYV
ncbi:hypothetical protein SALBM311S_10127 [Streptomyces alboniger]